MPSLLSVLTAGLIVLQGVLAHPGHNAQQEAVGRHNFMKRNPRSVRSCAKELRRRGHVFKAVRRRELMAKRARAKRNLPDTPIFRRDLAEYNVSHASDLTVNLGDDETLLFSNNSSCMLQPEAVAGPYYVDGELFRSDVTEDQDGVPLYLDIQLIDTSNCSPLEGVFVDLWHCNSTGVYSGVVASGNGDDTDKSNLNATALRGVQLTDFNGVVQFDTIFPGHYTGRATHIHVMSHSTNSTTVRTNNTILGTAGTSHASHIGQLFFDQDLIKAVEANAPYSTNNATLTTNAEDDILAGEAYNMDPFVEYVLLGDSVADGILGWISLGIDPTADYEADSASTFYNSGGVANSNGEQPGSGAGIPSDSAGGSPPSAAPGSFAPSASASAS